VYRDLLACTATTLANTKKREISNSQDNCDSLRKAAIRNATSDDPSPNLCKTIPGIRHGISLISPVEADVPTYHQRSGFQRKSMKAEQRTGNALASAVETTTLTFLRDIHGNLQRVKALIDCSAMSIVTSPHLLRKLDVPQEQAVFLSGPAGRPTF